MVYSVDIYDKHGKVVSNIELNGKNFSEDSVSPSLMHEFYLLQASNGRINIAHTKTRAEVAGSGRKILKQKGTGSARGGDLRSPIRRKGGVAFGPRNEKNFVKDMPKKARKKALNGLLTLKAKGGCILGFTGFDYKTPSTKNADSLVDKIGIKGAKTLVVINEKNNIIEKSFRNLENVKYILVDYLNPFDLMYYDKLLFTEEALNKINAE